MSSFHYLPSFVTSLYFCSGGGCSVSDSGGGGGDGSDGSGCVGVFGGCRCSGDGGVVGGCRCSGSGGGGVSSGGDVICGGGGDGYGGCVGGSSGYPFSLSVCCDLVYKGLKVCLGKCWRI